MAVTLTKQQKEILEKLYAPAQAIQAAKWPDTTDALVADSITSNSVSSSGLYQPGSLYTGTLGHHTGMSVYPTVAQSVTVKKAPRVCDELDSLASLSAVEYALDRRPDGISMSFTHANKLPLNNLVCNEVHLEAAFRSALSLYLLPYFDRNAK